MSKGVRFDAAFLKTRVARRILTLFVVCALIPIVLVAVVSYFQVSHQLTQQSRDRMRQQSKAMGLGVVERLGYLAAELRGLADRQGAVGPSDSVRWEGRFSGITLARPGRVAKPLMGEPVGLPDLTADEQLQLKAGRPQLLTLGSGAHPQVLLLRALRPTALDDGVLVATVNDRYLWTGSTESVNPAGEAEICVLRDGAGAIYCSQPMTASMFERLASRNGEPGGVFTYADEEGRDYVAGFWSVFLRWDFGADDWLVVLSEARSSVLAPMANFKRLFPFEILLALWVVLLASNVQIRRSMEPLRRLKEGTDRIAGRDFETEVVVRSHDEFEDLAGSFNTMARQLGRQFDALTTINEIDRAVLSALDTRTIVRSVVNRARKLLAADAVAVAIREGQEDEAPWTLVAQVDGDGAGGSEQMVRLGWGERVELADHPDHLMLDRDRLSRSYLAAAGFSEQGVQMALVVPVTLEGRPQGLIALGYRQQAEVDDDGIRHARQIADQVAIALSNARLIEQLDALSWGTMAALARTIDAKSPWTAGHSERVTAVALELARQLELSDGEVETLHRGGLLHDIGKIGVPPEILDKAGPLTAEELQTMRDHVTIGARILDPIGAYSSIIPIVLYHHEWLDGSGYPHGLRGDDIPMLARLLAVPDVFDALTSDRPYRAGLPVSQAVDIIRFEAGRHFDTEMVRAFDAVMAAGKLPMLEAVRSE